MLSRRQFVWMFGGAGAAIALSACGPGPPAAQAPTQAPAQPAAAPTTAPAAAAPAAATAPAAAAPAATTAPAAAAATTKPAAAAAGGTSTNLPEVILDAAKMPKSFKEAP